MKDLRDQLNEGFDCVSRNQKQYWIPSKLHDTLSTASDLTSQGNETALTGVFHHADEYHITLVLNFICNDNLYLKKDKATLDTFIGTIARSCKKSKIGRNYVEMISDIIGNYFGRDGWNMFDENYKED